MKILYSVIAILWIATFFASCGGPSKPKQAQPTPPILVKPRQATPKAQDLLANDGPMRSGGIIVGPVWEWVGIAGKSPKTRSAQSPLFTLELRPDGWFYLKTDCGTGSGMYETSGNRVAFAVVNLSRQKCAPTSQQELFVKTLETTRTFSTSTTKLYLDHLRETKTMIFRRKN